LNDNFKEKLAKKGLGGNPINKRKMVHAIQLKWTFLALKWAVFVLKLCPIFPRKQPLHIASKT